MMIFYFGASTLVAGLSLWFAVLEYLKLRKIHKGVKKKGRSDENLDKLLSTQGNGRPKPK